MRDGTRRYNEAASASPAATGAGTNQAVALQLPDRADVNLLDTLLHSLLGQEAPERDGEARDGAFSDASRHGPQRGGLQPEPGAECAAVSL